MKGRRSFFAGSLSLAVATALGTAAWAVGEIQIGPSGETYASAGLECALHPVSGMAPVVQAGLYRPRRNASGTVSLDGAPVAPVTFSSPDATVWLANGVNTVSVTNRKKTADSYSFDASLTYAGQPNVCIPDTSGNVVSGDLESAASGRSSATVTPGCAWNPLAGQAQPFVNLFHGGGNYLLNVSVNNVPLTQLSRTGPTHTPVFLSAGLNVISAAAGALSTDYYVRHGGTGSCTLP